jgi:hypothetical protein
MSYRRCEICNEFIMGSVCTNCNKNDNEFKCYYCGGDYKGTKCKCGRGVDIINHRSIMEFQTNKQIDITPEKIAKGLMFFKSFSPHLFKTAKEALERQEPQLLQEAREFYKKEVL